MPTSSTRISSLIVLGEAGRVIGGARDSIDRLLVPGDDQAHRVIEGVAEVVPCAPSVRPAAGTSAEDA